MSGCAKSVWPSDVKPGAVLLIKVTDDKEPYPVKVLAVEGDWLSVEYGGAPMKIAREKVTMVSVVPKR